MSRKIWATCDYCGQKHRKRQADIRTSRNRGYNVYCSQTCRNAYRQEVRGDEEEKESQVQPLGPYIDPSYPLQTRDGAVAVIESIGGEGDDPEWPVTGYVTRYERDGVGSFVKVHRRERWGLDGRWSELGLHPFELDLIYQEET